MVQPLHPNFGRAGSSRYGQYYKRSARINPGGVIAAAAMAIVFGAVMGVAYSAAIIFIPFIKIRFFGTFFYGLVLGVMSASFLIKFKVRDRGLSIAILLVSIFGSYYTAWASWEAIVARNIEHFPSFVSILTDPKRVYYLAQWILDQGTWSLVNSERMQGPTLLAFWIVEALIILGLALFIAFHMVSQKPFCEKCQDWCIQAKTLRVTATMDEQVLRAKLESGDFSFIGSLPAPVDGRRLLFREQRCHKCKQLNMLIVVARADFKDQSQTKRKKPDRTIINRLLVDAEVLENLKPPALSEAQQVTA
jgi:hypothetical protein